jgi:hypothetical protein
VNDAFGACIVHVTDMLHDYSEDRDYFDGRFRDIEGIKRGPLRRRVAFAFVRTERY